MKTAFTIFAVLMLSCSVRADDLVAVLDLKFIRDTESVAAVLCFGDKDEDCGVYATHYLYEAKIRKIINGKERRSKILVAYGRHALLRKNFRGVVAVLRKLDPGHLSGAEFQIQEWGELRTMYCFNGDLEAPDSIDVKGSERERLSCYNQKREPEGR